jgi:hypothetical protein
MNFDPHNNYFLFIAFAHPSHAQFRFCTSPDFVPVQAKPPPAGYGSPLAVTIAKQGHNVISARELWARKRHNALP